MFIFLKYVILSYFFKTFILFEFVFDIWRTFFMLPKLKKKWKSVKRDIHSRVKISCFTSHTQFWASSPPPQHTKALPWSIPCYLSLLYLLYFCSIFDLYHGDQHGSKYCHSSPYREGVECPAWLHCYQKAREGDNSMWNRGRRFSAYWSH